MKKIIIITMLALLVMSCGKSLSRYECHKTVVNEFPNAYEIKDSGRNKFSWYVIDSDSNMYYIHCGSLSSSKITTMKLLYDKK